MIFIYSKPACSQCLQASALLRAKSIPFMELKLGTDYELDYLQELCASFGKPVRTFPIIFRDETECIGDLQELKVKLSQGLV